MWTNDPERDFARWDAEQAEQEGKLPECDCCGNRAYVYYDIFGHTICENCIDDFKHEVEVPV